MASSAPRAEPDGCALMQSALDVAYVRTALVEVVGEDDYRTRKWDELVAQLVIR